MQCILMSDNYLAPIFIKLFGWMGRKMIIVQVPLKIKDNGEKK